MNIIQSLRIPQIPTAGAYATTAKPRDGDIFRDCMWGTIGTLSYGEGTIRTCELNETAFTVRRF
eukprot:COSAG01_NODE_8_length_44037_cov_102.614593_29_plen_64_part_00